MNAPPLPRRLQVEVTASCNLRCHMCLVRYRPPRNRYAASVDLARFRALVDALPGLEAITLQGLGEPLLAPDLFPMIEYAAARGIATGFNTNGTLLTRAVAERLVASGLAWLCISLDGARRETYEGIRDGATFATVARHVAGLMEVIRARGADRPDVSLVVVAMRRNMAELAEIVALAAEWGVPTVRVQNLAHSFSDRTDDPAYAEIRVFTSAEALWTASDLDAEAAFADAERRARDLGVTLRLPALEDRATGRPHGTPACDWPWRSAYVRHHGKVQPCCMLMARIAACWATSTGGAFRRSGAANRTGRSGTRSSARSRPTCAGAARCTGESSDGGALQPIAVPRPVAGWPRSVPRSGVRGPDVSETARAGGRRRGRSRDGSPARRPPP